MSLRFSSLHPGARIILSGVVLEVRKSFCREDGKVPSCGRCFFRTNHCGSFICSRVGCNPNQYREEYVEFVEIGRRGE